MWAYGMDDGSAIVLINRPARDSTPQRPRDVLSSAPTEVAQWVSEAVAAGITFDVLKSIAVEVVRRGWAKSEGPVVAERVTATVTDYLLSSGYLDVQVSEIRRVAQQGWTAKGTADGTAFLARSDESGNVVHVRVR